MWIFCAVHLKKYCFRKYKTNLVVSIVSHDGLAHLAMSRESHSASKHRHSIVCSTVYPGWHKKHNRYRFPYCDVILTGSHNAVPRACPITWQWRHNERDEVSNHHPHDCLLNRLFKRRSKKTSKLRVTGLCEGNSPVTGEFPAQRASNAENISIWGRHHSTCIRFCCALHCSTHILLFCTIYPISWPLFIGVASLALW